MKLKVILTIIIFFTIYLTINNYLEKSPESKPIINTLHYKELGYTENEIEKLKNSLTAYQLATIINDQIPKEILIPYFEHKYFNFDNLYDYEQIRIRNNFNFKEAINYFNHPHLMSSFYQSMVPALNTNSYLVLVNKNYYLSEDYRPINLTYAKDLNLLIPKDINRNLIEYETYLSLIKLFNDAEKNNLYLYLSSGYRSYQKQASVYENYALHYPNADLFSARAGHSEHQTGLAVDITCQSINFQLIEDFENTKEGKFIENNAYKYGFIIRYPKEKVHLTGYNYEPWHLRYVGLKIAKVIHNENITLEEYLLKYTEMSI